MSSPRPEGSGFRAFWTSLPGILTGVAAVVGAVATLVGVFGGGGDDGGSGSPASAKTAARVTASPGGASSGDGSCLDQFLSGIPADRRARIEVGAEYAEIISAHRRLSGRLGIVLLRAGHPLGAVRTLYDPRAGYVFPLEAVVDAGCRPAPHENPEGGEPNAIKGGEITRITLEGRQYDFSLGASTSISASFATYQG